MQSPMITRNDYTFAESEADDHWAVRLHSEFPGVTYMYGQIKVKEKEDSASIDFRYKILDPGQWTEDELNTSDEFRNYIGAVLQHVIEDAFENGKAKLNDRSEHTTNNTEESPFQ